MNELFFHPMLIFIFDSPVQWLFVIAIIALLFGANKLPELANSLGQARKEFKKGMREAEEEEQNKLNSNVSPETKTTLSQMNDDEIMEEIRRRQAKQLEQTNVD